MEKIHVTSQISGETHEALKKMAYDRGLYLQRLNSAILEWAGDQNVQTLIGLGLRVPVYADEVKSGTVSTKK